MTPKCSICKTSTQLVVGLVPRICHRCWLLSQKNPVT